MKALILINYLEKNGLEGKDLVEATGTTRATISRIKSGEIEKLSHEILERAGQYLNKKPSELLAELEKMRSTAQE